MAICLPYFEPRVPKAYHLRLLLSADFPPSWKVYTEDVETSCAHESRWIDSYSVCWVLFPKEAPYPLAQSEDPLDCFQLLETCLTSVQDISWPRTFQHDVLPVKEAAPKPHLLRATRGYLCTSRTRVHLCHCRSYPEPRIYQMIEKKNAVECLRISSRIFVLTMNTYRVV